MEGSPLSLFIFNLVLCCTLPVISWINYDRRKIAYRIVYITLSSLFVLAFGTTIFVWQSVTHTKTKLIFLMFSFEAVIFWNLIIWGRAKIYIKMNSRNKRRLAAACELFNIICLYGSLILGLYLHYAIEFKWFI